MAKTLVGAWYFAGWGQSFGAPHFFTGITDWRITFPLRQPQSGWYDDLQTYVDQEILLTWQNAIDFWAIDWYPPARVEHYPGTNLNSNNGLRFFLTSPNKNYLRFCLNYVCPSNFIVTDASAWNDTCDLWIGCFKDSQYLRVGGKPVLIIDSALDFHSQLASNPGGTAQAFLTTLRSRAAAAGIPSLLIGGTLFNPTDVPTALADGFDFVCGDYASVGNIGSTVAAIDYGTLLSTVPPMWDSFAATGAKYVPVVCASFDRRPLELSEGYFNAVTPLKYQNLLNAAKTWLGSNPNIGMIINYALNELSEGGILIPTLANGNELATQVRTVFGVNPMVAITSAVKLYSGGARQKTVLMRLTGVNSGDSIDVSSVGPHSFKKVQAAAFVGCDQKAAGAAAVTGTVVSIISAGMVNDVVNLLVIGE